MSGSTERIRVVHVVTRPDLGGAQLNTLHTLRGLDRSAFEPFAVTSPEGILAGEIGSVPGARTFFAPELVRAIRPAADARAWRRLLEIFREVRPHVVHTHCSKAGILGRFAARTAGVPAIVHTVHGFPFHDHQPAPTRALYRWLERLAARRTDRFLCVSAADLRKAETHRVFPRERATLVRSGIPLAVHDGARGQGVAFRREHEIPQAAPLIGMIACLKPQKDPLTFVRAAALIAASAPRARFVLVGDGVLRREVERELDAAGLAGRFALTGWRRDVAVVLDAIDVAVLTSIHEGLPRVVLEAMAAGKPVVATAVDGTPEAVGDGETGRLVPVRDPGAVAAAVLDLLGSPERARRLGEEGRRRVRAFDIEQLVPEQERVYRELLEAAAPRRARAAAVPFSAGRRAVPLEAPAARAHGRRAHHS